MNVTITYQLSKAAKHVGTGMNEELQRQINTANEKQLNEILFGIELIIQGVTAEEAITALIARREHEVWHKS